MNAPCLTEHQFASQIGSFLVAQAMLPLIPLCMNDDDVVYVRDDGGQARPPSPLVRMDGIRVNRDVLPAAFRDADGNVPPFGASDFRTEHFELEAAVGFARHEMRAFLERDRKAATLKSWALECRMHGYKMARTHDHLGAARLFLTSAVVMHGLEGNDERLIGRDLFRAARKMSVHGRSTRGALLAEMAAALDPASDHYSAWAAEAWLHSLREYDDPSTARFRISRGILHARRFFNRAVTADLFEASAALYLREGAPASAAFEYLRAANALAAEGGYYEPDWERVCSNLMDAFDLFVRLDSDLAVQEMAVLVRSAGVLAMMVEGPRDRA